MMKTRYRGAFLVAVLGFVGCVQPEEGAVDSRGSDFAMGEAMEVGMSATELSRIGPAMQQIVDDGGTGGVVTLVARDGVVVHWEAHGWRVLGDDPLERDDIFRIYSMTKPVTSVAVMMLMEDGLLDLEQSLSDVIPAFGAVQVYEGGALRPPARPITIRDLLRHTAGLTYGIFSNTPVDSMYRAELGALDRHSGRDLQETVGILAGLPLLADPGTLWHYSMATDVLGRVVEIVSGASLADFFHTRIFEPLGMDDTAFHVAQEDLDRLTAVYASADTGLVLADPPDGAFARPPSWYSGGGGLTSTPSDYLRFAQMLLQEGVLGDVRILEPETVRLMRSNQLDEALLPIGIGVVPQDGFGLGFAVSVDGPEPGSYSWLGLASTWFWIDPVEDLVAFAWTQFRPAGPVRVDQRLREIVSEAVVESNRVPATAGN